MDTKEKTLPDNHPDLLRIVVAAHRDIPPPPAEGQAKSLANALASALGKAPGCREDLENIAFLVHVLSVNRASGELDDETFEQLLKRIETRQGRVELVALFTEELEAEHGYEDD
ncbi:MAG: hypothetical protein H6R14_1548 [Proteobacteria bacterium]|nr:hypothetical protein [Pseudomonadota bacterium]